MQAVPVLFIKNSVAAPIQNNKKVISEGKKKPRLVLETAHNRTDLNIAITNSSVPFFEKDRRWTALKVCVDEEEKIVQVNINSLSKRFNIKKSAIQEAIKKRSLETLVRTCIEEKVKTFIQEPTTVPIVHLPSKSLHSHINRIKIALADIWWKITTWSWTLFKIRFLIGTTDEQLQNAGQLRALGAYKNAYERVPAYKEFVCSHVPKIANNPQLPKKFEDIPPMDKKEYIQKARQMDDLYLDGKIPEIGQLDSSTGTTGEPSLWIRSEKELAMTHKLLGFARTAKFNKHPTIVINTFALGLWATGITIAGAGPKQGLIANVGIVPDYVEKAITIIKNLSRNNKERTVVLCGYPPNIRTIANAIQSDDELSSMNLELHAVVGGEGMTEDLRNDILEKGFTKVFSSYGASDLAINVGYETETEVTIRKACIENSALAQELYGGGPAPMIFHYDPLNYFIETTPEGELLYTCCEKERSSPRIRYNLHDTGKTMMAKDVIHILKKYGVEITPRTNLPFLFIHGREGTLSYGGSKVHYEHLEEALRSLDAENQINRDRFALYKGDNDMLEFWIETDSDAAFEVLQKNINLFQKNLVDTIAKSNTDFKKILDSKANPYPQVKVFKKNQSPMSVHAVLNPHRKLQRVVNHSAEVQKLLEENPDFIESTGLHT